MSGSLRTGQVHARPMFLRGAHSALYGNQESPQKRHTTKTYKPYQASMLPECIR